MIGSSTLHVAALQTPNLEQFWSVESVGITPKDELTSGASSLTPRPQGSDDMQYKRLAEC